MRRTDHLTKASTPDADFVRFLTTTHAHLPIFVATDNAQTQRQLVFLFGDRVKALKPIAEDSKALRHTALTDAVVELFTCVEASVFKGSYKSSFSDTIHHLRQVNGRRNEADEHEIAMPKPGDDDRLDLSLMIQGMKELAQEEAAEAGRRR